MTTLEVALRGRIPPPPSGGPPRTERSPLPCGHLPTPWGVTPFRGGLCKRIASKENRLIQYLVTFYIVFGKSNRTAIVNVKTYCAYFLVIFIFSDTRKCTVADIYSSTFTNDFCPVSFNQVNFLFQITSLNGLIFALTFPFRLPHQPPAVLPPSAVPVRRSGAYR